MQNDEKPSKPTSFLHLLKKLAYRLMLVTGGLAGVVVLFWVVVLLYEAYGDYQRLSYMTSDNCSKHDSLTQICEAEAGLLYLRRVDIDNKRISVADIADDAEWDSHRYGYEIFWFEPCEEGVEIETAESWSDGKPVTFICATKPHLYLSSPPPSRIQVSFTAAVQTIVEFDSNGFSMSHDYRDTDYSPLLRKHALTSTDIKKARKVRLEQEAEERKLQLQKEAKEQKARKQREAEKEAKKQKLRKEREARLAKAKMECEQENQAALLKHEDAFVLAHKKFKEAYWGHRTTRNTLTAGCSGQPYTVKSYSGDKQYLACNDLRLVLRNTSEFRIASIRVGWDKKGACQSRPTRHKMIYNLDPGEIESMDTYLLDVRMQDSFRINRQTFCMKISDVSLVPKRFVPKKC